MKKGILLKLALLAPIVISLINPAQAQTSAFTYQGKLTDTNAPANGQYDFTFRLFDAASGGAQIGADVVLDNASVAGGIFTVNLDFGANAFTSGAARFLEISVRAGASAEVFVLLTPRQPITSAPFSIKSLLSGDALQLGGFDANQFVLTTDARLSDARNPLANSSNYIQNRSTVQPESNFNLSGSGTANIFNAMSQFNLGGQRILGVTSNNNLFAGIGAGAANPIGFGNSFFGINAGNRNTDGNNNSFFGQRAGFSNTSGVANTFIGAGAGSTNTTQTGNTFVGSSAGISNVGNFNTFIGNNAGGFNQTGEQNIAIGHGSDLGASNLTNAIVIGTRAQVTQSNSMVLGNSSISVGIGTTAPAAKLEVSGGGIIRARVNSDSNAGFQLALSNQPKWSVATVSGGQLQIYNDALGANAVWIDGTNNRVGIGTSAPDQMLSVNGNASKTGGGSWTVFSDERLKNIDGKFTRGLAELLRLSPVFFEYKPDNPLGLRGAGVSVGFSAQEVERVIPEAVSRSANGYLQLNNDPILWTMLNAVKEQQAQIEQQKQEIDALKSLVCELKPEAAICKGN